MKINFKKLQQIECDFSKDDVYVTRESLRQMINIVLDYYNSPYIIAPDNVKLAINSLKELGIIEEIDVEKKIQQINS